MKLHCHPPDIEAATILTRRATSKPSSPEVQLSWKDFFAFTRNSRRNPRDDFQALVESGRHPPRRFSGPRRVRPPFRLAGQKDGRWPREAPLGSAWCQAGEVKREGHAAIDLVPAMRAPH